MRTLVIMDSISRFAGGLFDAERRLHQATARIGLETEVFALDDAATHADLSHWLPLRPHVFRCQSPTQLGRSSRMRAATMTQPADLIYRAGLWRMPSRYAYEWSRKWLRPSIIAPHGMLDPWATKNSRWKKQISHLFIEGPHLRNASCIRALGASEKNAIRTYGLRNPVCVIPNGVDLVDAETLITEALKTEKKTLLFLGRLHPKKGLVNALKAWHSYLRSSTHNRRSSDWQFVIAGWDQGGHEADLKRLCDNLELPYTDIPSASFLSEGFRQKTENSQIVFVGPAFGVAKYQLLRQATAFILPSFSEGLPMSVLEAWSYRLPVLMTEHCNLPEGFAAGAALRIGTDVESIAEGMRQLQQSSAHDLQALGLNGRALVERQFTWPMVAAQMKEVYEWVLGGGARPGCVEM